MRKSQFSSGIFFLTGAGSKIDRISIPLGAVLQEIKVDCGIDDRSSIVICKKGKTWEVTRIAMQNLRFFLTRDYCMNCH